MEHVFVCIAGTSVLRIEVDTYGKAAVFNNFIHCKSGIVDIAGEAVGIPSEHDIALVGID